ncbi:PAS-domain containing protein [Pseudaestuariivita atlantica]|uniref:Diguanylate cyclase n=1 Tax=Pseudaestuariivita atlantica TaxID=1317121 RepID=A0A0L1JPL6_9RHOB|nr:PAS-domain containing protein [Pseudaestuariivita atlantica]KNG93657.1 hypothetical protein ATO11_10685 [Pseudaestuariivita atlantica]
MLTFGWLELAVILGAALGTAAFTVRFLSASPNRLRRDPAPKDPIVLVLSEGRITRTSAAAGALLDLIDRDDGWAAVRAVFEHRFPDLPEIPPDMTDGKAVVYTAADAPNDPARLVLTTRDAVTTITLEEADGASQGVMLSAQVRAMASTAERAPHPMWILDNKGALAWGNAAYWDMAQSHLGARASHEVLFDVGDLGMSGTVNHRRCAIGSPDPEKQLWFDVSRSVHGPNTLFFATEVTAVVRAEAAQRNFVQTLTKTFAHLSIGLAIFDRDRQLALFNPALIDLTDLSPEFLSQRPNLMSFFDGLRENHVMPEPKNYTGWRETLADVVIAASDGRYSETWNLPSGLTYRVTGRPHPDGAIAFLFEDISAEISLTRRFREELEIGHAVLDTLETAVAVFSPSGRLTFSNTAYDRLWGVETDTGLGDVTVQTTSKLWQSRCHPSPAWTDIRDYVMSYGPREEWSAVVRNLDGRSLTCEAEPLSGGATLVRFKIGQPTLPPQSVSVGV